MPLRLPPEIFKANDIRGVYGETLTEDIARCIGLALAAQARAAGGGHRIAIGRDGRLSSPALAAAVAEGLCAGGMRVLDIGLAPTPALYYAAVVHAGGAGVMITGSHNPKDHNGAKMMLGGKTLKGELLRDACARAAAGDLPAAAPPGKAEPLAIREEYIAAVVAANPLSRPLSVVLDAGNGAAGEYAPALFRALGCEVAPLFCEIDGNFPNHHPDPAQPQNLQDAAARLAQGGDVAFAFDGDGDRMGAILPGVPPPIFADRLLMLFARDMLRRNPGAGVVFDVKCTAHLAPWIKRHGGAPDMQPTGHAFIKARMRETGALLGGEMSGHFYFRENWHGFDDGLFAAARLAAILAKNPDSLADAPDSLSSPELHVDMRGKDQHGFVAALRKTAVFPTARNIVAIDGLRAEYADGFGLARASNTTPALVLRFEGESEEALSRIREEFRRALLGADAALSLPF